MNLLGYKPKFAEPFSTKRHRDNEDTGPSSASLYGAGSPPYRSKASSGKQHPSPSSTSNEHRPSPPPLLPLPTRSLPTLDSSSLLFEILLNHYATFILI